MSPNHPPPSHQGTSFLVLFLLFALFPSSSALSQSAIPPIQTLNTSAAATTIPAFPDQSVASGCPLDLPDDLTRDVKAACGGGCAGQLQRSKCCPVLAAWLYTAYSGTALGSATSSTAAAAAYGPATESYAAMPVLPEDTETCEGDFEKALTSKKIVLPRPNETCGLASCCCGIWLRPLSCPAAFSLSGEGKLTAGASVRRVEKDCLHGCNNCLKSILQLNGEKIGNTSKSKTKEDRDRVSKMQKRDCQIMGLTWILAKNRSAYFHTVSMVIRAIMMTTDGSDPQSCSLNNSDGMPLAVASSQLSDQSASNNLHSSYHHLSILSSCFLYIMLLSL